MRLCSTGDSSFDLLGIGTFQTPASWSLRSATALMGPAGQRGRGGRGAAVQERAGAGAPDFSHSLQTPNCLSQMQPRPGLLRSLGTLAPSEGVSFCKGVALLTGVWGLSALPHHHPHPHPREAGAEPRPFTPQGLTARRGWMGERCRPTCTSPL